MRVHLDLLLTFVDVPAKQIKLHSPEVKIHYLHSCHDLAYQTALICECAVAADQHIVSYALPEDFNTQHICYDFFCLLCVVDIVRHSALFLSYSGTMQGLNHMVSNPSPHLVNVRVDQSNIVIAGNAVAQS